jgi:hypothetical protein
MEKGRSNVSGEQPPASIVFPLYCAIYKGIDGEWHHGPVGEHQVNAEKHAAQFDSAYVLTLDVKSCDRLSKQRQQELRTAIKRKKRIRRVRRPANG